MDIPWVSIIIAILGFFGSKKKGASSTTAALVGAAAGVGSYFLFDPSNPDNMFGVGDAVATTAADKPSGGIPTGNNTATTGTNVAAGLTGLASQTIDTGGKVLTSWGATGTAGVIATKGLVSGEKKWLLIAAAAVAAIMLLK